MKSAVEEIREALRSLIGRADNAIEDLGDPDSDARVASILTEAVEMARPALFRLDELEKQIAEAEERGRGEGFGVLHALREALPTISGGIRHHAFKAREAFAEVERALCHYDTRAAERAKGGG